MNAAKVTIINEHFRNHTTFEVTPIDRFSLKFPFFRKPLEIGSFSLNAVRKFQKDRSKLKFYIEPKNCYRVNFDLKIGYERMIRKNEHIKEYLNDLLKWVSQSMDRFRVQLQDGSVKKLHSHAETQRQLNTDFICWRGMLTKLLCTPFENRDGWKVAVCLYNGTYYLCEYDTEEKNRQKEMTTKRQDEMSCWGWKFEQYVTADEHNGLPDTESPVNNNEAFCTVVRSRLNSHSLVYGGEVDAVVSDEKASTKYLELKTSREIESPRQDQNLKRFKLIKWWAQSFLVGIEKIVCGFRDDYGIVHRLETYDTLKIPEIVKTIHNPWDASVCFNFLDQFLSFIKKTVTEENPRIAYVFEWEPKSHVTWKKESTDAQYHFLPDWYIHDRTDSTLNAQKQPRSVDNPT